MSVAQPRPQDRPRLRQAAPQDRPQDRLRLREGAGGSFGSRAARSTVLWTVLSLSLIGYFVWYYRAQRDCQRLMDRRWDSWLWMVMLFPGMLLIIPYAIAQARLVAQVELATRRPLPTAWYVALCVVAFLVPSVMPLVLQPRLNRAVREGPGPRSMSAA